MRCPPGQGTGGHGVTVIRLHPVHDRAAKSVHPMGPNQIHASYLVEGA